MRAIVLSGGGSKGAYEIGVWKALRKLHIKYDIVVGTSVGALNAALMTQNTYFKSLLLWKNIDFNKVIDNKIDEDNIIKSYADGIKTGGMNTSSLEKTVSKALNLNKIYKSKINMGIVTFDMLKLKPLELEKKDIKKEQLKDYLVASASCFPAFKPKKIDNSRYIDGGYYDNLPVNFATRLGATDIIAVDLKEIGLKRKIEDESINLKVISPRNKMGSFLVFNSKCACLAIKYGYNDTLKEFNKLDGNKYTFKKGDLFDNYKFYINKYNLLTGKNISLDEFNEIVERVGTILDIDDAKIYSIKKYNKIVIKEFKKLKDNKSIKELINENKLKNLFLNKYMVKYIYNLLDSLSIKELKFIFKREYECAIYLKVLEEL